MTIAGYDVLYEETLELTEVDENPITAVDIGESGNIAGLEIDNTRNIKDSFVKLYGISASERPPSVGVTVPDWVFRVRGGTKLGWFFRSTGEGYFLNPVYVACVTTKGVLGNQGPLNRVDVVIKRDLAL